MNTKTAAALEESIAHWRRMREDPGGCEAHDEDTSDSCCALCGMFFPTDCLGCPVSFATGKGCRTDPSPWRAANWVWYKYHYDNGSIEAWRSAADAEIAFLEGLRDE